MPVHNWKSVPAGTFHHFHQAWTISLGNALNQGVLPRDYYALAEQMAGDVSPDLIALHRIAQDDGAEPPGTIAVQLAPPAVRYSVESEQQSYLAKKSVLAIRHSSEDRIIAMIELVSPGNKSSRGAFDRFIEKAVVALAGGVHLLLIDLLPAVGARSFTVPQAVWDDLGEEPLSNTTDKPLSLSAFSAGLPIRGYIEPIAVGDQLVAMPLFLTPDRYVPTPLEETYQQAFAGLPRHIQEQLNQTSKLG